jgi:hypothetical protein
MFKGFNRPDSHRVFRNRLNHFSLSESEQVFIPEIFK